MPKRRLNDLTIRALPLPEKGQRDVWDTEIRTFGVRCSQGGSKTFILKQNNTRITLGRYPYVTLKEARQKAHAYLSARYNPSETTLPASEAVSDYLKLKKQQLRPGSFAIIERTLTALPNANLASLSAQQFSEYATTRNAFVVLKSFLTWCVQTERLPKNPLQQCKQPFKVKSRARLLTDDEVRLVWQESHNHNSFGSILRCLILSGQRLGQFTNFTPQWMQGNTIVFPPEIMKGNEQHTIPLLGGLRGNLPTLSKPFTNHSTAMQKFREALPRMPHWTAHDARRYFSSTMAKLHVPIDITEAILSHTAGSRSPVQRTYDRYDRLEPMRAALAKYEEYVLAVVSETANLHSAR